MDVKEIMECGEGWLKIIEPLVEYIEKYNEGREDDDKIVIQQIKEKFGGLHFYVNKSDDTLEEMIKNAKEKSYEICELCGSETQVGQIVNGWITTCCHDCVNKISQDGKHIKVWKRNDGRKFVIYPDKDEEEILTDINKTTSK